jgi:RNA polymerase sigma-70 factor (ECF subfamily)
LVKPQRADVTEPLVDLAGLYREHAHSVRRFALYLSGDAALADDLVSEAFVRVWTVKDRVELTTVRGYLFATVRNLFLTDVRRQRQRAPLDERFVDHQPDPEERARDRSSLRTVLAALRALPEVDRAAVLMRADEGLPYEEIAAVLAISTTAAKVKVHRARLKLAEVLQAAPGTATRGEGRPWKSRETSSKTC